MPSLAIHGKQMIVIPVLLVAVTLRLTIGKEAEVRESPRSSQISSPTLHLRFLIVSNHLAPACVSFFYLLASPKLRSSLADVIFGGKTGICH